MLLQWVARTLQGDLFFDIPPEDASWNSAWNLFWNDAATRDRYNKKLPFQVYACWNGLAVFGAGPLLGLPPPLPPSPLASGGGDAPSSGGNGNKQKAVGFRSPKKGECYSGEPTLFCKDLWRAGYGRIAVVPSVNLEYSDEAAKKIKDLKGYTSSWWTEPGDDREDRSRIQWVEQPPEAVKCVPTWEDQSWRPWNESLS